MTRSFFASLILGVLSVASAFGAPVISIGTQYMLNTSQTRRIPIYISTSSNEKIEGVNLYVQVGDGGAANGGTDATPAIVSLDVVGSGTVFNASNTGCDPFYLDLMAAASTTTASGSVSANGVLAYLTVNPNGATVGSSYRISLQNVGANVDGGPFDTDLAGVSASFVEEDGWIQVVSLHDMKWSAGANGAWTDKTWSNSAPPSPNYTANAVVDTAYLVTVSGSQEANSLKLSSGGKLTVGASASLALTAGATVASGSELKVVGSLLTNTVTANGKLTLTGGTTTLQSVTGTGVVTVGGSASLVVGCLVADTLVLGGSSASDSATASSADGAVNSVPEPSFYVLLAVLSAAAAIAEKRRR